jgi:hypothetical protein
VEISGVRSAKKMKKFAALFLALGLVLSVATPAQARVFIVTGGGAVYYPGYPAYYYPGYTYPYYPAYYPAPTVIYASPPPVAYAAASGLSTAAGPLAANQTSQTFVDAQGRTCRQFQTTNGVGPAAGIACLMPDGSWRTVP